MPGPPIRIDDPDDPRIAAYRDIRERDLVGREGRFIAEGKVVLTVLFEARRFAAESVLVLESRLAGLEPVLASAPADLPVYVATRAVMDAIAGFPVHRGILAIGRRGAEETPSSLLRELAPPATVIGLVGISNHDNMGAIFRNAAAFGAAAVLLDETCCDPLYRKSIRVSVGAALKVPFAKTYGRHALMDDLRDAGFDMLALSPGAASGIEDMTHPGRLALLLGTEGEGLPPDVLKRTQTASIRMAPGFDSLNVATAAAVALHHFLPRAEDAAPGRLSSAPPRR